MKVFVEENGILIIYTREGDPREEQAAPTKNLISELFIAVTNTHLAQIDNVSLMNGVFCASQSF